MSKTPKDWFSVEHTFTVNNSKELFEFLQAVRAELQLDTDCNPDADLDCQLACEMLNAIGVATHDHTTGEH